MRCTPFLLIERLSGLLSSKTPRAILHYAGGSIVCQFLRLLAVVISTRALAPAEFGLFALAVLAMNASALFREWGQSVALYAYAGTDLRYARFHWFVSILGGLAAAFFCFVGISVLHIGPSQLTDALPLLCLILLADAAFVTPVIMAQKSFRFRFLAVTDIISILGGLAYLFYALRAEATYVALIGARLVEAAIRGSILSVGGGWKCYVPAWTKELRDYFFIKFGRYTLPQCLLESVSGNLDTLFLGTLGTPYQLGLYERAQQFLRIPLSLSLNLVDKVALVGFSEAQNNATLLRKLFKRYLIGVGLTSLLLIIGLLVCYPFVFPMVVGLEWSDAMFPLFLFAIPMLVFRPITWLMNIFFQGIGHAKVLLQSLVVFCILNLLFGPPLVVFFKAEGMFLALGIAYAGLLAWNLSKLRFMNNGKPH